MSQARATMAPNSHSVRPSYRALSLRPHSEDMALANPIIQHPPDFGQGHLPRILSGQERSDGHATSTDQNIAISSTSKQAGQMVAPFLAAHIPAQYNPFSHPPESPQSPTIVAKSTNTKYCYRHRPDLKCRRQVNEPSMEQLQNVRGLGLVFSVEWRTNSLHRS